MGCSTGGDQGVSQEAVRLIRFRRYNIWNVRNGGIESTLQGMLQENLDLGVFQETKVTKGMYTQELSGYRVVVSEAPSEHCGGVAVLFHTAAHLSMEVLRLYTRTFSTFSWCWEAIGVISWGAICPQTAP